MICPNCSRELPDGTKFCGGCGTPISASQKPIAAQPVTPVQPVKPVAPVKPVVPVNTAPAGEKKGFDFNGIVEKVKETVKKIPAKYLKIGGIALAALVVLILVISLFGGGSEPNYAMYLKDEQVYYHDFSNKAPYQLTEDYDSYDTSYFRKYAHMTDDGETLFYFDDGDLYYRSLTNMKKDATKIDSNVEWFHVSENGKLVTYIKNGKLIQHNLKKEEVIAKDVYGVYAISDDGKIIYFSQEDGDDAILVCWNNGKTEELEDDIEDIFYISEDCKTIYYYVENDDCYELYSKQAGKDAELIAENAEAATDASKEGTFYYGVYLEGDCGDYITDAEDYGIEDENMGVVYQLYYYNGSKSELVSGCAMILESDEDINGNALLYYIDFGTLEEDSLSYEDFYDMVYEDDMSYEEARIEWLTDATGEATYIMTIDGKTAEVELEDVYSLSLAPDGKSVYALCDVDDDGEGTLYKASVSGGKVKAFKEIDSDVYYSYMYFGYQYIAGEYEYTSYMYYYKDVKDGEGTLCVDGEEIDSDVYVQYLSYSAGKDLLLYYVDYKDGEGMLKGYNGKKSVEICDDVYSFSVAKDGTIAVAYDYSKGEYSLAVYDKKLKEVGEDVYSYMFTPDGDILYLMDYSTDKMEGDLYWYNGSKSKLLDEDVISLIRIYDCTNGCIEHP